MENTISTTNTLVPEGFDFKMVNLLNLTKSYISDTVKMATKSVTEGHYDPIKALVYAKKGQELFTQLEKSIRPIAEDQQKLSKGEVYSVHNADVSQKESGVKYDFSTCDDREYNELKEKHESISADLKVREEFLKRVNKDLEVVDTETGESYTIHPPVRSGKMGLTISIKP
ncbi:hypothetical protein TH53_21840 [Pedobacter lusitanus]|uniref:Uncharacterized protein n=1 Tax=Pedobacter lusitanus TaxID=1503925 RepID=A0A0D0GGI9_9SPHI|nr:hypothetical protein [Pedobacter lusitanus]KIO75255.1 hypothetical protein TH53_21840 [Pedobacter lusitanus]